MYERSSKLYLFRGNIISSLLFRVKEEKKIFMVSNPTVILVYRDADFSLGNTCLGCFL